MYYFVIFITSYKITLLINGPNVVIYVLCFVTPLEYPFEEIVHI